MVTQLLLFEKGLFFSSRTSIRDLPMSYRIVPSFGQRNLPILPKVLGS